MKLSKPSEMGETEELDDEQSGDRVDVTGVEDVVVDTFGGEMSLRNAVSLHGEVLEEPEAFGLVSERSHESLAAEVEELRSVVEDQREALEETQKMVGELIMTVEVLSMSVDANERRNATEVYKDHGGSRAPLEWDEDAYAFKEMRYE